MNPKLADDFFGLCWAVFVRREALDMWLAIFLKQQRFDDFESWLIKERKAMVRFAVPEDFNKGRRHGRDFIKRNFVSHLKCFGVP